MNFKDDFNHCDLEDDVEEKSNIQKKKTKSFFERYKTEIIIEIVLIIVTTILLFLSFRGFGREKSIANYLVLYGDEVITMEKDSKYIELGYSAYNSDGDDLTSKVKINSNLDTSKIGEYQITYTVENITKIRKIIVANKSIGETKIELEKVNDDRTVYIEIGQEYIEPGYKVYNSTGKDLSESVKIDGKVDTSKAGKYTLVYSVIDNNRVVANASRNVIVMDTEISLTVSTTNYTNSDVSIEVVINDKYFDYLILPDGSKVTDRSGTYSVSTNGTYTFKYYNKKGIIKEKSVEVHNIDKVAPKGSCTIDYNNDKSTITINATDESGISKYIYNNKTYTNNKIVVASYIESATINIYDKVGNVGQVSCKAIPIPTPSDPTLDPPPVTTVSVPTITSIRNDGVIVTVKAQKQSADISGYYFSYTSSRPNKNSGGYLSTSKSNVDVVRLPGTTYVWVEDKDGRISNPTTINLNANVIPFTSSGYTILQGTKLSDYLKNKGWSLDELNKLIARSVRAAGLHTKEGAATAAVAMEVVLIQKYGIKIPYWQGGKTSSMGAYSGWGAYRKNPTYEGYNYYGMDCDGLVNWSFKNAGIEYNSILSNSYYHWSGIGYSKENGEVGDVLRKTGHVAIIVGKTNDYFIVAEAAGKDVGVIISKYSYGTDGYQIIKGERLIQAYEKIPNSEYPKGF